MNRDDVMRETVAHTKRVGNLVVECCHDLMRRAVDHDESKFFADEFDAFAEETPKLREMTYGSPEYQQALERLGPTLRRHYSRNRHHPEHFSCGIDDMNLLDLIEMLADWKAATERHADGDLLRSIDLNAERFGYDDRIKRILRSTAFDLGWTTAHESNPV